MRFDENLRNLRKEKDYSQEYLAEKLGVTRQTISKWENGTAMPDLKKLIELADFFESSMDDLLGLDYKTVSPKQSFSEDACNDYNEAEAILANRYTNELIHSARNQIDSKTKVLSIFLAVVSIAFVISVISFSGKIGSLENQINGLNASYAYLQERINSNGDQNYDSDDYYDVEVTILKTYSETPYIVQAELKYAPSSYPKNSKIYYLLPKKDGGVDRLSAQENNGEFIAEADIDLSLDKPVYFVLDDGENVIKQEVYLGIEDVLGTVNSDITYGINEKSKNEFLFTNSETYVWNNSRYTKLNSADLVVAADGKEVYRQALKKSELKYDETNEIFDSFYEIDLPTFYIKDLKEPKKFDIYVEVKLDNGVLCKSHLEYNSSMYYPNEGMEMIGENPSYMEYVFSVGDKTVTIKNNNQ
ncbi:MAG: helix-turn-helix transcriptional regulator [Eubacterium sp.]|nr:helix-turn-helix transcriptional regulator [Eubacterium sp.]